MFLRAKNNLRKHFAIYCLGSQGEGQKYFMVLKVANNIGQDALLFSSDNQAPNGMLVKKGSTLTVIKSLVSRSSLNFVAIDGSNNARLYLNNMGKLKVQPSHSQDDITEVTLTPSGEYFRYRWSRMSHMPPNEAAKSHTFQVL